MTTAELSRHGLRSHCHRHRPRRLCLRDPRGAARPEDRGGGEGRRPSAAPASMSAASRRRRCCTPPSCSRKPATPSPRWASRSASRSSISAAMMKFKDEAVDGNVKGVDFLFKKNKVDAVRGAGRIAAARQGRGEGRRRQDADARNQEHRHRHRLRCRAAQGHRDRREAHRVVDRRAGARQGAGEAAGRRRRRDRARARLGVAAARRAR